MRMIDHQQVGCSSELARQVVVDITEIVEAGYTLGNVRALSSHDISR